MKILEQLDRRKILLGLGVALVAAVLVAALWAWLIGSEVLALEQMNYGAALALLLASFLGAHCAGSAENGAVVGVGLLLVLLGLNAGVFGAAVEGLTVTAGVIFGGCGASALLRMGGTGRKRSRRRRRKNR